MDAVQMAKVNILFDNVHEVLLPFTTMDWTCFWLKFIHNFTNLMSSLASEVLLWEIMVSIVPVLPKVLILVAKMSSSPSHWGLLMLPHLMVRISFSSPLMNQIWVIHLISFVHCLHTPRLKGWHYFWSPLPLLLLQQLSLPILLHKFPWPNHACAYCSYCQQKWCIPKGYDPFDMSQLCLCCIHDKKTCDWTKPMVST